MAGGRLQELREFVTEVDADLQRYFPFTVEKVAASGAADDLPGTYFVNGLASVYNKWSLDLGGFRERIKPGAFDAVLKTDPHVLHVWDHDTSKTLSSTRNGTLEIKSAKDGLHYHSKVAPTSYAKDLEILLRRRDIDQSSFAFIPEEDEWRYIEEDGKEIAERTITKIGELFDVTTCAMGAYPQTDAALAVRSLAKRKQAEPIFIRNFFPGTSATTANVTGTGLWVPKRDSEAEDVAPDAGDSQTDVAPPVGDPETPDATDEPDQQPEAPEPEAAQPEAKPTSEVPMADRIAALQSAAKSDTQAARNRYHRVEETE